MPSRGQLLLRPVTTKIPFTTRTVKDATTAAGTKRVRTRGVAGAATLTYRVTLRDGVESGRALVRRVVTKAPVTQVTVVGTRASASCDPNYAPDIERPGSRTGDREPGRARKATGECPPRTPDLTCS